MFPFSFRFTRFHLYLYTILILTINQAYANPQPYARNSFVSDELWNELEPYFLPIDSPEKEVLDHIFSKKRVLKSTEAMRQAGFLFLAESKKVIVARHYKLRGYIIKVFLDSAELDEGSHWKKRIDNAKIVQESIARHGYEDVMKVPKKWIYPLPEKPSPKAGQNCRNFILIAEDMYTLTNYKNYRAYKKKMTIPLIDKLYTIITENFMYDSIYPHNVPFCKDGKLAFVDTEYVNYHKIQLPLFVLTQYLSGDTKDHWHNLDQEYKKHHH